MRVAFLSIHGYVDPVPNLGLVDTGGQVVYVLEMAKHLARLGVHVDIYTRRFGDRSELESVCPGVRIIRIPCGPEYFVPKEKLYPYLGEFAENMVRYISEHDESYDIIHTHYWDAGYVGLIIKDELGVPMAHTSHSLGMAKRVFLGELANKADYGFGVRIRVEKDILLNADTLVSASPLEPELVEKYYGVKRHMYVVPAGVDTEFFSPEAGERDLMLPDDYVFTTGRMEWTKGFDLLVAAFGSIAREFKDLMLLIGGGSERPTKIEMEVRATLRRMAKEHNVEERVIQTGRISNEDLPTYYARARIVVLPSRYDLYGIVALEGLSCGRPVVVSKYAGVSRLIPEDCGLVADPYDSKDLGEKISTLLRDQETAAEMGMAGRKFVEKNLTWDRLARRLLEVYRSIT